MTGLDEELARLTTRVALPYPERLAFLRELRADIVEAHRELRASGMTEDEALAEIRRDFALTGQDLEDLEEAHRPWADRCLSRMPTPGRSLFEALIGTVPLGLAVNAICQEERMIEFIREGGAGMYAILGIGFFLLGRELLNAVRLLVLKQHSPENLSLDTASVLLGCGALLLSGIGWTSLGIYISASAIEQSQSYTLLLMGIKESLTPLVLSSLLAALVMLFHYSTRQVLRRWQAPLPS